MDLEDGALTDNSTTSLALACVSKQHDTPVKAHQLHVFTEQLFSRRQKGKFGQVPIPVLLHIGPLTSFANLLDSCSVATLESAYVLK